MTILKNITAIFKGLRPLQYYSYEIAEGINEIYGIKVLRFE
jgi:hypothetical protein